MQSTNCRCRERPKRALEDCENPLVRYKRIYRALSYSQDTWLTWLNLLCTLSVKHRASPIALHRTLFFFSASLHVFPMFSSSFITVLLIHVKLEEYKNAYLFTNSSIMSRWTVTTPPWARATDNGPRRLCPRLFCSWLQVSPNFLVPAPSAGVGTGLGYQLLSGGYRV